jgi:hypothetical protein
MDLMFFLASLGLIDILLHMLAASSVPPHPKK